MAEQDKSTSENSLCNCWAEKGSEQEERQPECASQKSLLSREHLLSEPQRDKMQENIAAIGQSNENQNEPQSHIHISNPLARALWETLGKHIPESECREQALADILHVVQRLRPLPTVNPQTIAAVRAAYIGALAHGGYQANAERITREIIASFVHEVPDTTGESQP